MTADKTATKKLTKQSVKKLVPFIPNGKMPRSAFNVYFTSIAYTGFEFDIRVASELWKSGAVKVAPLQELLDQHKIDHPRVKKEKGKGKKEKKERKPRKASGFQIFTKEKMPEHNGSFGEKMKAIAAKWKALNEEEQQEYKDRALAQ